MGAPAKGRFRSEAYQPRSCDLVWWGQAPFRPYDVNEAADVLILKVLLGRKPRRAGVCIAVADWRTVGPICLTFSRIPTQCSCKTLTRGSARPAALQNQVTYRGSILRSHLKDDREPRLIYQTSARASLADSRLLGDFRNLFTLINEGQRSGIHAKT